MISCHPFPHFPPRHTPPQMSSEVMHNLSTGADMSARNPTVHEYAAHEAVTAQAANALYAATQTDWPVSGSMTIWRYAVPLGPAYREARDVTHGAAATGHLGILWGSTDDWRNRDAVAHPSRRITAVGYVGESDPGNYYDPRAVIIETGTN